MREVLVERLREIKGARGALLPALQTVQELYGYISQEGAEITARELRVSLEELYSVATFYSQFSFEPSGEHVVSVCLGTACYVKGARQILARIERTLGIKDGESTPDGKFTIGSCRCLGLCGLAPVMTVDGIIFGNMTPEKAEAVVRAYMDDTGAGDGETVANISVLSEGARVVLRNCGNADPESIDDYIAHDGYEALKKALTEMTPQAVIDEMSKSGLRGRGGAGFPTGTKWGFAAAQPEGKKFVICNADEGDPGAFMDRAVLELDPFVVLEAMAIAGYAIGASEGFVYVRAEYPLAVKRIGAAIKTAGERGYLGENIFGLGFSFRVEMRLGAGAFVCGEETALMASIEGRRGEPRQRPPFPAVKGLWGRPSILNNVETLANVPRVILLGAEKFAETGTEKSKGTKVFALGGKVERSGLVEAPMGTTLREIVYGIGGGIPGGRAFKAAQTGGPSGGCIPAEHLDVPMDYENLTAIGSMMGSGGLIVLDEDNCMVDIAKYFLDFTVDESCGKCTACRIGTRRLYEILEKITNGEGETEDLEKLEELCAYIKENALCALGQTAPNPVLSTLRYFREEYVAHTEHKRCPAGVCRGLLGYKIDAEACVGCGSCARVCPVGAISGERRQPHTIDSAKCVKCGACLAKCSFNAISR
ncbi:MAG: NAD(P)H-dependent oxidoreductase subunit E [Oscillospiraceae bacterium]|nr:NAD(P)H-dependent oxidoreductase subunit E [Oscillospiraceae bacterium]